MCTNITMSAPLIGVGRGEQGWFPITQANVGFDHATHSQAEHAILLDFVNPDMGVGARIALEMNIASGKALIEQLQSVIEAAEASGAPE
jgi:hypothetical protein